jgi:ribosome biogenesis GTPase
MHVLASLGWNSHWQTLFAEVATSPASKAWLPARVTGTKRLTIEGGTELLFDIPGRLRYEAESALDLPSVGDWVAITARLNEGRATIEKLLPRKSRLARRAAGDRDEAQVIAANVDTSFIVTSLNEDFSQRRIERYLSLVRSGGSTPVILLSKTDLTNDADRFVGEIEALSQGAPVIAVSARTGAGFERLRSRIAPGETVVVIGSSGVGKSTLINSLFGSEILKTQDIRDDDSKGRHTTTDRYLLRLPGGGLIIDTPGMREVQLWDASTGVQETFDDIDAIALQCKFTNCRHENEKGCAIREALKTGAIDQARLESFIKLRRETASGKGHRKKSRKGDS